jgi:dTDP-glucose 4,6-dehydratase
MPPLGKFDLDHILDRTEALWDEARGSRFFITGGSGFFGMWLLESFCHINSRLNLQMTAVVLTRSAAKLGAAIGDLAGGECLKTCEGDIKDFAFPEGFFAYAVHAATETLPDYKVLPPYELISCNVEGTKRFLELVKLRGIRKFLFTSSGAIYGPQPVAVDRIREDARIAPDHLLPASAYGEAKRLSEALVSASNLSGSHEGKIARCFAFVGPRLPLDANYAIGNLIGDALAGRELRISGDGTPLRSYLYAADLTAWLWTLLFKGAPGEAYNVGSGKFLSIRQLAELVRSEVAPEACIKVAGLPLSSAPPSRYVPDNEKACRELGVAEWIDLPEAIRRTADWYRIARPDFCR